MQVDSGSWPTCFCSVCKYLTGNYCYLFWKFDLLMYYPFFVLQIFLLLLVHSWQGQLKLTEFDQYIFIWIMWSLWHINGQSLMIFWWSEITISVWWSKHQKYKQDHNVSFICTIFIIGRLLFLSYSRIKEMEWASKAYRQSFYP